MVIPAFVVWSAALGLVALGAVAGWAAARAGARLGGRFIRHRCNGLTVWDGSLTGAGGGAEISLYVVVKRRSGAAGPVVAPSGADAPPALQPQRSVA